MTRPSITPHEDARRVVFAQQIEADNDVDRAVSALLNLACLEFARAMDRGEGTKACTDICISACASMMSTLAHSATSTDRGVDEKSAKEMILWMLMELSQLLFNGQAKSTVVDIDQARPVRA